MVKFSYKYPEISEVSSYWGETTSTIDWCEENNVITHYIDEFINTTSNLFFMFLALFALYRSVKNGFGKLYAYINFGFFFVGLSSWMFHMTLLYNFQLFDELSMLYSTWIPIVDFLIATKTLNKSVWISMAVLINLAVTVAYLVIKNPVFHQVIYAMLNLSIVAHATKIMKEISKSKLSAKSEFKFNQAKNLVISSVSTFLFGFLIWNLDNIYCSKITQWKRYLGIPLGFLLEGHGWWHIFTGLGVYYFIVFMQFLRLFELGQINEYKLVYRCGFLADIVKETNDRDKQL